MANRLTQIATRTGDNGTTGLGDNSRVSKNSLRVHAMGDVDELNCHIGVLLCEAMPDAVRTLEQLRGAGVAVQLHASADGTTASMKSQFKKADASGARFALVFGADEMAGGHLSIKDLRNASTPQRTVALTDWAQWAQSLQSHA